MATHGELPLRLDRVSSMAIGGCRRDLRRARSCLGYRHAMVL